MESPRENVVTSKDGEGHLEHRFSRLTMIGLTFGILKFVPCDLKDALLSNPCPTALGYVSQAHWE